MLKTSLKSGIPVSVSLAESLQPESANPIVPDGKKRVFRIACYAVAIAACVSVIAKLLIILIDFVTQLFFYGRFSIAAVSPADNMLGLWVILIPAVGGILVGLMAYYGSGAIRGHGIPEAMEQILTNQSKIKPAITYLKPLSSAITIGTGGPFGAEGPIIATGGALGSTLGQILNITHNERKILLSCGATAGMSAIFGSPVAAIFLAIELLLFEFSPRSIIPVALACITGAAGHHLLFGASPVFAIHGNINPPGNTALLCYSLIGLITGVLSAGVTRAVYYIEDLFSKLPVHWMWWPAIGGLAVGITGYFFPDTLGVGYDNIINVLNSALTLRAVALLFVFKFISWSVALGSGTSGGTLAPLLTIGGAAGFLLGSWVSSAFPSAEISVSLAALAGMSAMFAGASRALLTSIIFALETTGTSAALPALLAACTAAYLVSFFLMENTIMTEKIARRGIKTPDSFEPDLLQELTVNDVAGEQGFVINQDVSVKEAREWIKQHPEDKSNHFIITDGDNAFAGIISSSNLFGMQHDEAVPISSLIRRSPVAVHMSGTLKTALELMIRENVDVLPVISENGDIAGILSHQHIVDAYKTDLTRSQQQKQVISVRRRALRMLVRGQQLITTIKKQKD
ncbi:MAG: chloride channel protein [Terrimonas sp.]|nr:chloride channel protein [Terrimonas sp.]OJY81450.1 MAG: chloride channel protein [Sphingobacteriales bacterium 40-81]